MTGGMNDRLRQGGFDQGRGGRGPAAVMGADQHICTQDGIAMAQTQSGLARRLELFAKGLAVRWLAPSPPTALAAALEIFPSTSE